MAKGGPDRVRTQLSTSRSQAACLVSYPSPSLHGAIFPAIPAVNYVVPIPGGVSHIDVDVTPRCAFQSPHNPEQQSWVSSQAQRQMTVRLISAEEGGENLVPSNSLIGVFKGTVLQPPQVFAMLAATLQGKLPVSILSTQSFRLKVGEKSWGISSLFEWNSSQQVRHF